MKKLLTLVLSVLMVACFGITAMAADTPVCAFDAEDIATFMSYNTGLAAYGVAEPVITAVDGDDGKGVRVQGETASAWVQGFNIQDEATIAALRTGVTTNKYLKLYVNNTSDYDLGLRLTFIDEAWLNVASFETTHCVLAAKDGYKREILTADGGGMGANSAVVIPAGFDGYVYFDCANITIPYPYTNGEGAEVALMTDFTAIHTLEIDLRWNVTGQFQGGADVIFDSLTAVDEITEELIDPTPEPTPEPTPTPDVTEAVTEAPTEAPDLAVTETPSETVTETPTEPAGNNGWIIWVAIAAAVVVVIVVVVIISKKKKA
ncbi:MAG: hypothetical protein IKK58_01325 [Clostridia bacterium]|nr:hypothetical protein [Clostridia bacterium]